MKTRHFSKTYRHTKFYTVFYAFKVVRTTAMMALLI